MTLGLGGNENLDNPNPRAYTPVAFRDAQPGNESPRTSGLAGLPLPRLLIVGEENAKTRVNGRQALPIKFLIPSWS